MPYTARSGGKMVFKEVDIFIKNCSKTRTNHRLLVAQQVGYALGLSSSSSSSDLLYKSVNSKTRFTSADRQKLCARYSAAIHVCSGNSDCPNGLLCKSTKCNICQSDSECGGGNYCNSGTCRPTCNKTADCPEGFICRGSKCDTCRKDSECGSDRFCDDDFCRPKCKSDTDCSGEKKCSSDGRCLERGKCKNHESCDAGEYCQSGLCVAASTLGKECEGAGDCLNGQECVPDNEGKYCATACNSDEGLFCPPGFLCKKFDEDRSFCFPDPKAQIPANKEKTQKDGGGTSQTDGGGGCTCEMTSSTTTAFPAFLLLFLLLGVSQRLTRKNR